MSKQVEDNKEMQEDLKNREAELKREMEEQRQVWINLGGTAITMRFLHLVSTKQCAAMHVFT